MWVGCEVKVGWSDWNVNPTRQAWMVNFAFPGLPAPWPSLWVLRAESLGPQILQPMLYSLNIGWHWWLYVYKLRKIVESQGSKSRTQEWLESAVTQMHKNGNHIRKTQSFPDVIESQAMACTCTGVTNMNWDFKFGSLWGHPSNPILSYPLVMMSYNVSVTGAFSHPEPESKVRIFTCVFM